MLIVVAVEGNIDARVDLQDLVVDADGSNLIIARVQDRNATISMTKGRQAVTIPIA